VSKGCPCGSGEIDDVCCGMYHAGAPAPTALALMRSRYTAYVRGELDYLAATQRGPLDRTGAARWSRDTLWMGLEIVQTQDGGEDDDTGAVEFIARGVTAGKPFTMRERSRFEKVDGRWIYVDGKIGQS
jgi:SEC-C motif-containing protein